MNQLCQACYKPARFTCPEPPEGVKRWCREHLLWHLVQSKAHSFTQAAAEQELERQVTRIDWP